MTDSTRSVSHPTFPLMECLEMAESIHKATGGNLIIKRQAIAQILGYKENTISRHVGSCVQYGLLEKHMGEGYKISELYKKYRRPTPEYPREQILIEAFSRPPVYAALLEKFLNETLPNSLMLSNLLYQEYSITDSACQLAAEVFIKNLHDLNIIDEDNHINLNIASKSDDSKPIADDAKPNENNGNHAKEDQPTINRGLQKPPSPDILLQARTYPIIIKKGMDAQLVLPEGMEQEDFDTVIQWIELMQKTWK